MSWLFGGKSNASSSSASNNNDDTDFTYDDDVHTAANPYCGRLGCWCHTDFEYHEEVTSPLSGQEMPEQEKQSLFRIFGIGG